MPKVSVIIPVYNGEQYLAEAIDSVLEQTYPDLEIIVVDDGSTDQSAEIVKSYGNRTRYIYKENGGTASAMNLGCARAKGTFIAWLSADDAFLPNKISKQVEILDNNPKVGLVHTDFYLVNENDEIIRPCRTVNPGRDCFLQRWINGVFINASSVLFRREILRRAGIFDENISRVADADMWARMYKYCNFAHVPELLLRYRLHMNSASFNISEMKKERSLLMEKLFKIYGIEEFYPFLKENNNDNLDYARAYRYLAQLLERTNYKHLSEKFYIKSIELDKNLLNVSYLKLVRLKLKTIFINTFLKKMVAKNDLKVPYWTDLGLPH